MHFSKHEEQSQHHWWNQELSLVERADVKDAFAFLEEVGKVKRGPMESTTANLRAVLDYLLTEKRVYYQGKIDSKHDQTSHKYDQAYNIIYNKTKGKTVTEASSREISSKIKTHEDDEIFNTDTQSSALKGLTTKTGGLQPASEAQASSLHDESESADKMENVTIFGP